MIKFENTTDLTEFKQAVKEKQFSVEKISDCKYLLKDNRFNGMVWELFFSGRVNEWVLHYQSKYENSFSVRFISCGNIVEIYSAIYHGRNEKSDIRLQKYKDICTMANCFINCNLCK